MRAKETRAATPRDPPPQREGAGTALDCCAGGLQAMACRPISRHMNRMGPDPGRVGGESRRPVFVLASAVQMELAHKGYDVMNCVILRI